VLTQHVTGFGFAPQLASAWHCSVADSYAEQRERKERERVVTLYGPNVLSFMTVCFISICCMMYVLHVRSFLLVHVNSDEFYLNCAKPRPPLGPTTFGAGRRCAAEESQPPMVQTL
jgi:hypothetical protein